ncbi:MAG: hypothetical protein NTZ85_08230 [Bacteroidia bacterium]|jgi:hypothetical protein|nr:hypothetical protein [Bacteroidia bacterium]
MKINYHKSAISLISILLLVAVFLTSCKKLREINYDPEVEPLRHGIKTSAAIGYCASLAAAYFNGAEMPGNVTIISSKKGAQSDGVIMEAELNNSYPLPFNSDGGQIFIAGLWNGNGGIITALFTDIDIVEAKYKLKCIHTIPVSEELDGHLMTLFAGQDVIIGNGSDTLLNLNMSVAQINLEMDRLGADILTDPYVIVQQNVWFINIDPNNTYSNVYDDEYTINGGGQIAEVLSTSEGVLYHAMINTKIVYSTCNINPISGVGFIQNLKVGTKIDLGDIFLSFHDECDGKAYCDAALGKYLTSTNQNVNLNLY